MAVLSIKVDTGIKIYNNGHFLTIVDITASSTTLVHTVDEI